MGHSDTTMIKTCADHVCLDGQSDHGLRAFEQVFANEALLKQGSN